MSQNLNNVKRRNRKKHNKNENSKSSDDYASVDGFDSTSSTQTSSSSSGSISSHSKTESEFRKKNISSPEMVEEFVNDTFFLKHEEKRPFLTKKRVVFTAGIMFGLLIASFFAPQAKDLQLLSDFIAMSFLDLDFTKMLPANVIVEELLGNITMYLRPNISILADTEFLPGLDLAKIEGISAYHPVTLIPGIVSTGLESWSTSNCSRPYFRKRMWGTTTMFRAILMDKECWRHHMRLDPITGLDPPGVKLRAAQGLDAADYLFPGYWVWGKMIQNLAAIGYDNNNMHLAAYDWRLSFYNLEIRDKYFSKLKANLELAKKSEGRKSVVVGHSMGSLIALYFFKWVESPSGGNGGPNWVNDNIEAFVNIAGPLLGLPKALSALLSGEMRDTVELGAFGIYLLEKFFSKRERADLFRTWGGLSSMLPKGGEAIWGVKFLHKYTNPIFNNMLARNYSYGISTKKEELEQKDDDKDDDKVLKHAKWTNPLESQLPNAPDMKIYCLYGWGKETERRYYYSHNGGLDFNEDGNKLNLKEEINEFFKNIFIDSTMNSERDPHLKSDGTVPLISLGYMCTKGWKNPLYNPANIKVITREFQHETTSFDLRGGAKTADHVDIMGNYALTEDVLRVASGDKLEDRIFSRILEYSEKVQI
nr:7371_t:CDS:10 [Entrophospora candida]